MSNKNKLFLTISILIILITSTITYNILKTYSMDDYTFKSDIYNIESEYITSISPKTTIDNYYNYFDIANCQIELTDESGTRLTSGYVYTGSITKVYTTNHTLITSYINIIKGDINKDGIVDKNDLIKISSNIINNKENTTTSIKAMDINNDNEIKATDIALINSYLTKSYTNLTLSIENQTLMTGEKIRIIPTIEPNIIIDQNLNWTTSNKEVATVNNAGLVTAYNEGTATITATTKDGTISKTATIIVDNTITLSETSGKIYIGGADKKVYIKSIDYTDLTCTSQDETLATCQIEDEYLIISLPSTTKSSQKVEITVTSPKYGTATYTLTTVITSVTIQPPYGCLPVSSTASGKFGSMNAGTISVSISDTTIIKKASTSGNIFSITSTSTPGYASITFTESNGNAHKTFYATVYKFSINKIGGYSTIGGDIITATITTEYVESLSCTSSNETIATCLIEDNILKVTPVSKGEATITITATIPLNPNVTTTTDKCTATKTFLAVIGGE